MRHYLARWLRLPPDILTNTVQSGAGSAAASFLQAFTFVLVARALGAEQYGIYAVVGAVTIIVMPFAGLGMGNLLVRDVARRPSEFASSWGNAILAALSLGTVAVALVYGLATVFFDVSPALVLLLSVANLIALPLYRAGELAATAFEHFGMLTTFRVTVNSLKLGAAGVLYYLLAAPSAETWAALYSLASIGGAGLVVLAVSCRYGWPAVSARKFRSEAAKGVWFAGDAALQSVNNDVDKAMLGRLDSMESAGLYAAAYRAAQLTALPISAVSNATYARFFKRGAVSTAEGLRFAKSLVPATIIYSLAAGILLFAIAPLIPLILGSDYATAATIVRWLSPLPLLLGCKALLANALTGADYQGSRTLILASSATVNIVANAALIPFLGWLGAVASTLATEALTVFILLRWLLHVSQADSSL